MPKQKKNTKKQLVTLIAKKRKILICWSLFVIALIASIIAEKFITKHPVAGIDGRIFFHAWFGFAICIIFVLFAKFLGLFIKRRETYYGGYKQQ